MRQHRVSTQFLLARWKSSVRFRCSVRADWETLPHCGLARYVYTSEDIVFLMVLGQNCFWDSPFCAQRFSDRSLHQGQIELICCGFHSPM